MCSLVTPERWREAERGNYLGPKNWAQDSQEEEPASEVCSPEAVHFGGWG